MSRKIVFMGTPLFAVPILKSLYQNGYPISVVFTQPEKKSKRGMSVNRTPIQSLSETLNLEFRILLAKLLFFTGKQVFSSRNGYFISHREKK